MTMSGINALPSYYPPSSVTACQGTLASQTSPYNIAPVAMPNYLSGGIRTAHTMLGDRLINAHPSSLYINPPDSARVVTGQLQDMVGMRNRSAMYAGLLNGVNHFNNCVINLNNNQPHQIPPMSELPFRIWQVPAGSQGLPVQVPVQSLAQPLSTMPSLFEANALNACHQMLNVCLTQLLQCQQNLAMLSNQMAAPGQVPVAYQPVQQSIQPFMIPMGQVMAHVQTAPMVTAGMPAVQMPVLSGCSLQTAAPAHAGALGRYYFEPVMNRLPMSMSALTTACPSYHHTPMQAMQGWAPFAQGFGNFIPLGQPQLPPPFNGVPLIYQPDFARKSVSAAKPEPAQSPPPEGGSLKGPEDEAGEFSPEKSKGEPVEPAHPPVQEKAGGATEQLEKTEYEKWQSCIAACCQSGDTGALEDLMKSKRSDFSLDQSIPELDGLTPIAYVAKEGKQLQLLQALLKQGAQGDLNAESPLLLAAASGGDVSEDMIKALLPVRVNMDMGATDLSVKADVLATAHKAGRLINQIVVLESLEKEDRLRCIKESALERSSFRGEMFDKLLGVDPDAVKEDARELYNEFLKTCEKCDYKNIQATYGKLIKGWPEFDMAHNYENNKNPLLAVFTAEVSLEEQVAGIEQVKELIYQQAQKNKQTVNWHDTVTEYSPRFMQSHRTPHQKKVLKMALSAPTGVEITGKVNQKEERYKSIARQQESSFQRYAARQDRTWIQGRNSAWKGHLGNWDKRELRLARPDVTDVESEARVQGYLEQAHDQQQLDEQLQLKRDLTFLGKQHIFRNTKSWLPSISKAKGAGAVASTQGELASDWGEKIEAKALRINETFNAAGRDFQMMALLDPQGAPNPGDLSKLVGNYLSDKVAERLEERLKTRGQDGIITGVREALKLSLVDVNQELAVFPELDLGGVNLTLLLKFEKDEGGTELWTVTLGDAVTALLHPDGTAEQISVDSPDNRVLGYNALNLGTSARGKITRRVLSDDEEPEKMTVCQFNGGVRKEVGLQAISELARRMEKSSLGKQEDKASEPSTIKDALKQQKDKPKKAKAKPPVFSATPVDLQDFVTAVVENAGNKPACGPLAAQAIPLAGDRTTLPVQELTDESLIQRLRLLGLRDDSRDRENAQKIKQLVLEINTRFSTVDKPYDRNKLLTALYVELLAVYGKERLLPSDVEDKVKAISAVKKMNEASTIDELEEIGEDEDVDFSNNRLPLTRFHKYQTALLAEKMLQASRSGDLKLLLRFLYSLSTAVDSSLDFGERLPFLAPYLNSLSNTTSMLWESVAQALGEEAFLTLTCDKLDKCLLSAINNNNNSPLTGEKLADLSGSDAAMYELLCRRLKEQYPESYPREEEILKGRGVINGTVDAEFLPKFRRQGMDNYLVDAYYAIKELAEAEFEDDVSVDEPDIVDIMQQLRDKEVDCDTPCFHDKFDGAASFIEILVDKKHDINELIECLRCWEFSEKNNHLTLLDRLNFISSRLDSLLEKETYERVENDSVDAYQSHIKLRKKTIEKLKKLLPASG